MPKGNSLSDRNTFFRREILRDFHLDCERSDKNVLHGQ